MILHSATQHGNHSPFGVVVSVLGASWSIMENMQQPCGFALISMPAITSGIFHRRPSAPTNEELLSIISGIQQGAKLESNTSVNCFIHHDDTQCSQVAYYTITSLKPTAAESCECTTTIHSNSIRHGHGKSPEPQPGNNHSGCVVL